MSRNQRDAQNRSTSDTDLADAMFDHEKLKVYQEAVSFAGWLSALIERTARAGEVRDQLDRASTSIALNIAEGNGKYTGRDRCRFFDTARGSALECAAGLDLLVSKGRCSRAEARSGKERLQRIVRMLMGLIKRNSSRPYDKLPLSSAGPAPDLDHDLDLDPPSTSRSVAS